MITGLHPSDSNPYTTIKESSVNINPLMSATPWRHPHSHASAHSHPHPVYSNPYVYDAAAAVALVGYSPYASSYSPHMDLAGRRKNATRETTATLKAWLYEHRKNPYPTKSEKVYLAIMTKMTLTQVSTWFANARRRLKKENKMTWSPRNRTNEEDDDDDDLDHHQQNSDRHPLESTSDLSDDEDQFESSTQKSIQYPSSTRNSSSVNSQHQTILSNIAYINNPLNNLVQSQIPSQNMIKDNQSKESTRKRKFDELQNEICSTTNEKKRSSTIWSLAEMAEKNENNKILPSNRSIEVNKQRSSSSSSCSTTSSINVHENSTELKEESQSTRRSSTPNSIPLSSRSTSTSSTTTTTNSICGAFKPLTKQ